VAEVLCVYREVAVLRAAEADASNVANLSYNEKSGIQAISNTTTDFAAQAWDSYKLCT
jgi:hypothetical protein